MSAALYAVTAGALLWAASRWVSPIGRRAAIVLALLPLCFTGRALLTDGLYGPFDLPFVVAPLHDRAAEFDLSPPHNGMISDLYTQIIPYRKAVRDALSRGEWPLWNPYTLCGEPLAASAQPAVYSPFTLLALLLPVAKSFTFSAAIWFFIAAVGAYLFARELQCSELASLFAAAAWMSSSALVFFILWPMGQTWTLLPLVLVGVRRLERAPWLLLAALTELVLAGHPETVVHVIFIAGLYGLMYFSRRALVNALIAGAFALGLCAIYLLPFMDVSKETAQYVGRKQIYTTMKRSIAADESLVAFVTDVAASAQQRLWRTPAGSDVRPYSACVGSIVLALFVAAAARVPGREKCFWFGIFVFCILEQVRSPLEDLVKHLPLFDIAINDRLASGAAFAAIVLATLAIDRVRPRDIAIYGFATLVVVLVVSVGAERWIWPNRENWGDYRFFADVALVACIILIAIAAPRRLTVALFVCVIAQRVLQEGGVYPTFSAGVAYPPLPILEPLRNVREPFRITSWGMSFIPGTNAFYGLEDVRGYSALNSRRLDVTYPLWCRQLPVFINIIDDLQRPFLSLMNVRYALQLRVLPTPPHWREITKYRAMKLLENENALPRAFIPEHVHVGSHAQLIEMSGVDDFRKDAWIEAPAQPYVRDNGPGAIALQRRNLGFDIDANMQRDGWIVVSESAWKGWRAYVDGRRIQHQYADIAFLGIYVPAGKHAIRLVYWPDAFVRGRAISGISLVALIAVVIVRRRSASRDTVLQSDRS